MFVKKTWTDRVTEYPTRRTLTKEDGTTEIVTVARNEGTVSAEGDAFSAANMNDLERRIADAQPVILTGTLAAGQTSMAFTSDTLTEDSLVEVFVSLDGVTEPAKAYDDSSHTLTLTFDAQDVDMGVKVRVS